MGGTDAIYSYLLKQIDDARGLPVRLDSEHSLATRFGVSRCVARRALQRLVREGRAVPKQGQGYFVRLLEGHAATGGATVGIVYRPEGTIGVIESRARRGDVAMLIGEIRKRGMEVELLPTQERRLTSAVKRMAEGHPVDAYVLWSISPALQTFFAARGRPAVAIGSTYDDLGIFCVEVDMLEAARALTERLFATGHRSVCLLQERGPNVGWERARLGFEYAHGARRFRFKRERIIRIDRRERGARSAMRELFLLAPTGMLVQNTPLLEWLWSRADDAAQRMLGKIETIVLDADWPGALRHPAKVLNGDAQESFELIARVLWDLLRGCPPSEHHFAVSWRLVDKP